MKYQRCQEEMCRNHRQLRDDAPDEQNRTYCGASPDERHFVRHLSSGMISGERLMSKPAAQYIRIASRFQELMREEN